jgi:hypothetical protein
MRHRFFLLLLTALPVIGAAQRSKLPVYKKVDSLIKAGIDTILLFNETHIGAMPPEYDSCGINFSCLAWRQDNKVFYQKFSTSGLYLTSCYSEVIHHQLSIAFKIMDEYKETIVGEYLQPFIAKIELKDYTYYQILSTAHPTIYQLEFY